MNRNEENQYVAVVVVVYCRHFDGSGGGGDHSGTSGHHKHKHLKCCRESATDNNIPPQVRLIVSQQLTEWKRKDS